MSAKQGNITAEKHGGAAAVRAIEKGDPLHGLAADAEAEAKAQLEAEGRESIVIQQALRLEAASRLYWNAISKAAQDGDLQALDRYIARFGWLASSALRAWAQVATESKAANRGSIIDLLKGNNDAEK